ncbi:MAG: TM2 domain-containing protein [Eggerthellaceae bacterium]|nr:TM2 domain-containing protein [Eggerthellaceae bacterium]
MSEQGHWVNQEASGSAQSSYWQGEYHGPEYSRSEGDEHADQSYGSMSAAARRSYASEAIRQKDHVSAGLFAIFLGMFGVHKFYLGCNNAGFIMLAMSIIGGILTFGLAAAVIWFIAIVEGITYLTKSQTEFDRLYVLNQRDWF